MDRTNTTFTAQDAASYFENQDRFGDSFDVMNPGGSSDNNLFDLDRFDFGGGGGNTTTRPSVDSGTETNFDPDKEYGGDIKTDKEKEEEEIESYYKWLQQQEEDKSTNKILLYAAIAIGIYSIIK